MKIGTHQEGILMRQAAKIMKLEHQAKEERRVLEEMTALLAGDGGFFTIEDGRPVLLTKEEMELEEKDPLSVE